MSTSEVFDGNTRWPCSACMTVSHQSCLQAVHDCCWSIMAMQLTTSRVLRVQCADPKFKENLVTTVEDLLDMNVVPVFNENDAISKGVVKATVGPARHVLPSVSSRKLLRHYVLSAAAVVSETSVVRQPVCLEKEEAASTYQDVACWGRTTALCSS